MSRDPDKMNHPPPGPGTPDPLVASLARLEPSPAALNRDRLMFRAGAESRRTVVRLWQLTAGLMAAVGFFAGVQYGAPSRAERVVYIDRAAAPTTAIPPGPVAPAPTPVAAPAAPLVVPAPVPTAAEWEAPQVIHPVVPGGAVEWLQIRNDVLAGGLGCLPDTGHRSSSAHGGANQLVFPKPLP